jgi:signal transduction histidine kinase
VSLGGQAPADVAERLLSGRLPVRPGDLAHLAAQLGLGADPRVASLRERLARAPAVGLPPLPAFRRTHAAEDRIEGWSQAGGDRLFYAVPLAMLVERAGVADRLLAPGSTAGVEAEVPDVAGLTLRVAVGARGGTGGERLRLALWAAVVAGILGLVAVRRALVREWQATAREKTFLAGVTHELRTPLCAIRLFGETLASGRGDPREYGTLVARESERLESLVERVLAVTRVDEAPSFSPVAPSALVASAVALIRPRAERREVTLETRLAAGLPQTQWDEEAVRRALLSLLDNAVTHGRERGHVTVAAVEDAGVVRVAVSDDGPGIARRDRGRIFGRFVRGSNAAGGTGLGLHLAEQVARAHGGRIDLDTDRGRGSTFTLVLPVVPPAARPGEPAGAS